MQLLKSVLNKTVGLSLRRFLKDSALKEEGKMELIIGGSVAMESLACSGINKHTVVPGSVLKSIVASHSHMHLTRQNLAFLTFLPRSGGRGKGSADQRHAGGWKTPMERIPAAIHLNPEYI